MPGLLAPPVVDLRLGFTELLALAKVPLSHSAGSVSVTVVCTGLRLVRRPYCFMKGIPRMYL